MVGVGLSKGFEASLFFPPVDASPIARVAASPRRRIRAASVSPLASRADASDFCGDKSHQKRSCREAARCAGALDSRRARGIPNSLQSLRSLRSDMRNPSFRARLRVSAPSRQMEPSASSNPVAPSREAGPSDVSDPDQSHWVPHRVRDDGVVGSLAPDHPQAVGPQWHSGTPPFARKWPPTGGLPYSVAPGPDPGPIDFPALGSLRNSLRIFAPSRSSAEDQDQSHWVPHQVRDDGREQGAAGFEGWPLMFPAVSAAEKRRGERNQRKRCLSGAPQARSEFFSARSHRASQGTGRRPAAMSAQRFWVLLALQKYLAEAREAGVRNAFGLFYETGDGIELAVFITTPRTHCSKRPLPARSAR